MRRLDLNGRIYILMWIYNNNFKIIRLSDILQMNNIELVKWLLSYDNYLLKNKRGKYCFDINLVKRGTICFPKMCELFESNT